MVKIIIDNVEHVFYGNELITPEQQAIEFLFTTDESKREF